MKYVVVKSSRRGNNRTYTGTGWERAGTQPPTLRNGLSRHENFCYDNYDEAQADADMLSKHNHLGFVVEPYKSTTVSSIENLCTAGHLYAESICCQSCPQLDIKYVPKTEASTYLVTITVSDEVFSESHVLLDCAINNLLNRLKLRIKK